MTEETSEIKWIEGDPPEQQDTFTVVSEALKTRPGVWALVAEGWSISLSKPWWIGFESDTRFETKFVIKNPDQIPMGQSRDVYARYIEES